MIRPFVFLTASLILVVSPRASASTYYCEDSGPENAEWVQKYFDRADVVFVGEVISAEFPAQVARPAQPENVGSMIELLDLMKAGQDPALYEHRYQRVTFDLLKVWKGDGSVLITARVSESDVIRLIPIGTKLLVFGHKLKDGLYSMSFRCGKTTRVEDADEKIGFLDKLTSTQ